MSPAGFTAGVRRVARVDLAALALNVETLVAREPSATLDARANAHGHGLSRVAAIAIAAGMKRILISPNEAAPNWISPSQITRDPLEGRLVTSEVYGFSALGTPVLTLCGEVIAVKRAAPGAGVSYGYSYRTPTATILALVALGYADGVPRLASNRATVYLGGETHRVVGRVAMDQFVVECATTPACVGDEVVLFGNPALGHPSVDEWAGHTERSTAQLTAGLGSRVTREYL